MAPSLGPSTFPPSKIYGLRSTATFVTLSATLRGGDLDLYVPGRTPREAKKKEEEEEKGPVPALLREVPGQ
jgi:hypothetical protein